MDRSFAEERRNIARRLRMLVIESDTTATKFSLFLAGALIAIGFWHDGPKCPYVACAYLEQVMPWSVWGAIWTVYAALEGWRVLDGVQRRRIALFVNGLGVFLFGGMGAAVTVARWPSLSISAVNIALAAAACWVFARTAINPGHGFRGD